MKSDSDFLLFLNKVEMAELNGLNYEDALRIVNSAVDNLENARATYLKLTNLADVTPYDLAVQAQLINFDYKGFQEGKGFNPLVFKAVEDFLSKGDIRGVYHKLYNDVSEISGRLYKVKAGLEKNELAAISDLWDIHQHYADSIFFGQYVAAMKKVWPIVFLNIIIFSFLSAGLQDIYKKGTIKLEPSLGFGEGTDWEALFYDNAKEVIVAGDGTIFVSNSKQNTISRFTSSGQYLTSFGQKGQGPGDLYFPGQMTILDEKYLVIAEYASTRRINLFDFSGKCIKILQTDYNGFGTIALKNNKVSYFSSSLTASKIFRDTVFIKDINSGKESPVFTGEVLGKSTFIIDGLFLGFDNQTGVMIIAQTGDGNLLVGLSSTPTIRIYSPEGKLKRTFELNMKPLPVSDQYIEAFREFTISE
ncbi:MAG: 6-bladed beta-propeller, partial [Candidatus Aminicenantes bacterium]|nr:6-bladed beta-propeller [Candidatus Aminicenantes bacterium]